MKRVGWIFASLLLCLCTLLSGCHPEGELNTRISTEDKVDSLDIFLVGDAIHEVGVEGDEQNVFYTTMMTLGDYDGNTLCYGEKGFVFYDAFEEYQAKTGIQLNLHWFPYPENMESALVSSDVSDLPDLILSNATSKADYYLYMKQGIFSDLSEFTEEDALYTEGNYYNEILKAGTYANKQYLLPIMFNIDTLMGCQRVWDELGLYLDNIETHKELMEILIDIQEREQIEELCGQFVSALAYYTPHILYAATGSDWIDYEAEQAQLDEQDFVRWPFFTRAFFMNNLEN